MSLELCAPFAYARSLLPSKPSLAFFGKVPVVLSIPKRCWAWVKSKALGCLALRAFHDGADKPIDPGHGVTLGSSSHVRPSSSRPAFFLSTPPHCLKKNGTPAATH